MDINKDARDRVFAAAYALYEQSDRAAFPTVDAVRKAAKVNMSDASTAMKEWRRAQTVQAVPATVHVPETIQQLHHQALIAVWQAAQGIANESLRAAQTGWDAERVEIETISKQLSDAYETQAIELAEANRQIEELTKNYQSAQQQTDQLMRSLDEAKHELSIAKAAADRAEARTTEIGRRADDLRIELDLAHQNMAQTKAELSDIRQAHAMELDALRAELVTVRVKADEAEQAHLEQRKTVAHEALRAAERFTAVQTERDQACQEAGKRREEVAVLRGQVAALKEQQQGLLEAIKTGVK